MKSFRVRMSIEIVLAAIGAALFVLTLVRPQWIEDVFGIEPDAGSGSLELIIALGFLATAVVFGLLARATRRRMRSLSG